MTTATEKACTGCGEVKPLAAYSRNARSKGGRLSRCKACTAVRQAEYREVNKERIAARDRAYREANAERIAAQQKVYRIANRDRIIARTKAYRVANAERISAREKAYREANREADLARKKAYHAERWATDPEYRAQRKARSTRYYRLLASAKQEPYTRQEIFERDGWICGICDEPIDPTIRYEDDPGAYATIDHVIPLSRGGDDTPANVQAAHFGCNSGKCDRVADEDRAVAA